ncbi:helix-turn-helix domain-containing protein [Mucilaginibacter calamicampi]|uniref:Helix-turn-helix domain-containing protein n=1 Tax=Mucilaginibacter calamicampi TaxID=1302352 RepID=A0ABW2YU15_9SPHI
MAINATNAIGINIRKFRERRGLTQDDLATYLKVKRPVISYWETGERDCNFDFEQLEKLAKIFNVDLADLLEENEGAQQLNYAFAFRSDGFTETDLESIADFQQIVKNYNKMKHLANEQS